VNVESAGNVAVLFLTSVMFAGCGGQPTDPGHPEATGGTAAASGSGGAGGMGLTSGTGQGGTATGGASTGGANTGGSLSGSAGQAGTAQGGASGSGGMTGGSGGTSAGTAGSSAGSAGAAGSAGTTGNADPSAGCGKAPTGVCDQQASPCTAEGVNYYIDMPANYDQNRAYPVVFQYHPLGGTGQGARTMYRVRPVFMDAIYVSPDGSNNGFPNAMGKDEAVTRAIMTTIEQNLCVDRARYFATGFSYGGSMSYTAACNMSDKFRAVAAMAGAPISGASCTRMTPQRPVAVLGIHGEEDTALAITMAEPIIETWIEKNGCTMQTQPSDLLNSICATVESALPTGQYQGCMQGYPVIWCPMPGRPHEIPMWSGNAIARFFMQF